MKKILSLGLVLVMILGMGVMPISADSAVTITPSVASDSEIDTVCDLSFEFNVDMNKDTLNSTNVVLKELIKVADTTADPTYNNRVFDETKATYNEETKTYTIKFEEGTLAPGNTYVIEFTTSVMTAAEVALTDAVSFTYTTKWGEYYINDDFSRYPVGTKLGTTSASTTTFLPWQWVAASYGNTCTPAQIQENNGEKFVYTKAVNSSSEVGYAWGFRKDYLPESRTGFTEHEVTFKFDGGDTAMYAIWSYFFMIKQAADGNFYMYVLPYGNSAAGSPTALDTTSATPLFQVEKGIKTKFRFVMYRDSGSSTTRFLYKLYKDDVEVTKVVDTMGTAATNDAEAVATTYKTFEPGFRMSTYGAHYFNYVGTSGSTSNVNFALRSAAGDTGAELWVYSFKYKAYTDGITSVPNNGETDVSVNSNIVLTFPFAMNEDTLKNITVSDDEGNNISYSGTYSTAGYAYTMTLSHEAVPYGKTYTVSIPTTVKTKNSGNWQHPLDATNIQFKFEEAAKVESTNLDSVVSNGDIKVKFTKAVDPSSLTFALQEEGIDYTDATTGETVDAWWNRKLPAGTYDDETHTYTISFKDAPLHTTGAYRLKLTLNGTEEILGTFTPVRGDKYYINENFDLYNAAKSLHYNNPNNDKLGPWKATTSNGNHNVVEFTSDGVFHAQMNTEVSSAQYVTLKYNASSMPEVDKSVNDIKSAEITFKYANLPTGGYIDIYGQILTIYRDAEGTQYLHLEGVVDSKTVDKEIAPIPENEEVTVIVNYVANNITKPSNRVVYSIVVKTNDEENTYTTTRDGLALANYNVSSQGSDCGVEMEKGSIFDLAMFQINKPASTGALTTAADLWVYEVKYSMYEKPAGLNDYDVTVSQDADTKAITVAAVENAGKTAAESVIVAAYDADANKLLSVKVIPVSLSKLGKISSTFTLDTKDATNVNYRKFRFGSLVGLDPITGTADTTIQ